MTYWQGAEVNEDRERALGYFRVACQAGIPQACAVLAQLAPDGGAEHRSRKRR